MEAGVHAENEKGELTMLRSELQEGNAAITACLVLQAYVPLGRELLLYRLLEAQGFYLIEVTLGEETVLLSVKEGKSRAVLLYEKLLKGTVTPCTAEDIWEDFQGEL